MFYQKKNSFQQLQLLTEFQVQGVFLILPSLKC